MINRYREYLSLLDIKLQKMFEAQSPFIKCKNGCAHCCKMGKYPLSELEFINLLFCYYSLPEKKQLQILQQIKTLLSEPMPDSYECPFLTEDSCSVYPERPLICRSFGLLTYYNDEKSIPFCVDLGLNYSDVYNDNESKITGKAPDGTEPLAYNADRRTLRSKKFEQDFNIYFGEDKPLYEFLKKEFSQTVNTGDTEA